VTMKDIYCKSLWLQLLLVSVMGILGYNASVYAEDAEEWMPDANLHIAIREKLELSNEVPLTKDNIKQLTHLEAQHKDIRSIQGLEFAQNLANLNLGSNHIRDISPLSNLVKLQGLSLYTNQVSNLSPLESLTSLVYLNAAHNPIKDLSPLLNNTNLETLDLFDCQISDVSPLTGLKNLKVLILTYNRISDFSPLASLTNLQKLYIKGNLEDDISALQGLTLTEFEYDEVCEIAPLGPSIISRIQARDYPSMFQAWDNLIGSKENAQAWENIGPWDNDTFYTERLTKHDLHWSPFFGLWWDTSAAEPTYGLSTQLGGELEEAKAIRQQRLALNPNMLFLVEIRIHNHLQASAFPPDSEFWLRDSNNRIIANNSNQNPMNLLNLDLQNLLIERIIAVAKCGLFDGVMIDGFNSNATGFVDRHFHSATDEEIIASTTRILREVRTRVQDNFLILVNTNRTKPTAYTEYVNGTFMETGHDSNGSYTREGLKEIEDTLLWAETQLREPKINCLEGEGVGTSLPNSPENQRWMRVFTTLSLTHSDGYVLYTDGSRFVSPLSAHHEHIWYDFWDAPLGRPVGGAETKGQLYENREGLFIREFTNGWAVYNRSGKEQEVEFPEFVSGVSSEAVAKRHVIPDLDGEMYLKQETGASADVNGDGEVNILDLVAVANAFGEAEPDLNGDGVVNIQDLVIVANAF
jgi:hypothetical protein